jgi:hypothetical protein
MIFRAKRNTGGRHAAQRAPVAPQDAPVAPVPAPPVTLGGGARLTVGGPTPPGPAFGPAFTGLRTLAGEDTAAVIALGGGCEVAVTRALWLDDLAASARVARDALTRDVRDARKAETADSGQPRRLNVRFTTPTTELAQQVAALYGHPLIGVEPKTGPPSLPEKVQREQIAAYRHATESDPSASAPDAAPTAEERM